MAEPQTQRMGDIDRTIARNIAFWRKARGCGQDALAAALAVSTKQVSKYEKGTNRISAGMLGRVAGHLGIPVAAFFQADPSGTLNAAVQRDLSDIVRIYGTLSKQQQRTLVDVAMSLERHIDP